MRLLPEKNTKIELDASRKGLVVTEEDITEYDILEKIMLCLEPSDYQDVQLDISEESEDAKIQFTVPKKRLVRFLEQAEKMRLRQEYNTKYLTLRERIGDLAVQYLISCSKTEAVDADLLVEYLPSRELIEEDMKYYWGAVEASCGYHQTDEGVWSLELAKKLAMGGTLDEYPEQLTYHYYRYPNEYKSVTDAFFTKSEFLASVKQEQEKSSSMKQK